MRGIKYNTKTFVERATSVHGKRYDYSESNYKTATQLVTIICPHHGRFHQRPSFHLRGHGCAYCGNGTGHVYQFLQKLNKERGWNLVGGNSEFAIPSKRCGSGYYKFDGCDTHKLIFFEYNEVAHKFKPYSITDDIKKQRLKEYLVEQGKAGQGTYVVYDSVTETLTAEAI